MSEEKKEGKKKGGKMPILIALVLVLGGGGFFMTQKKPEVKKEIEAAEESVPLGEMTVNLRDSGMYLKFELILLARKDYSKEKLEKSLDLVRDYVATKVPDVGMADVKSMEGRNRLKKALCEGINTVLPFDPANAEAGASKKKPAKPAKAEEEVSDNGWDCPKGPILKVMFKSFIWQ